MYVAAKEIQQADPICYATRKYSCFKIFVEYLCSPPKPSAFDTKCYVFDDAHFSLYSRSATDNSKHTILVFVELSFCLKVQCMIN